ncbi:putative U6 snRNA-associated Sm-like protein LSm4 [Lachnellula arida]|uniref:LSM complex subunit LSM4 n=1 Tax=Lachnellula arida TaxID=1316785 RepID=A0A8T9BJS1_9HELO|nr:putative U6 snRNA-associated Sm-like protein LSm4 [Lachnellula arida]
MGNDHVNFDMRSNPASFYGDRNGAPNLQLSNRFKATSRNNQHIEASTMLPLGLLTAAQGHPMLVELKNGETLNGHLVTCDTWMNLTLKEVVQTSPPQASCFGCWNAPGANLGIQDGDKFFRLPEVYVKGNNIKYLRVPDEIIDIVKDQQQSQQNSGYRGGRGGGQRGDHGGRGGDRGRGGRGGGRGRGRGRGS